MIPGPQDSSEEGGEAGPSCRLVATYRGHEDGVEAVAASPSGRRFASCGWDGKLLVWEGGEQGWRACSGRGFRQWGGDAAPWG
jgi:hypothetical protein